MQELTNLLTLHYRSISNFLSYIKNVNFWFRGFHCICNKNVIRMISTDFIATHLISIDLRSTLISFHFINSAHFITAGSCCFTFLIRLCRLEHFFTLHCDAFSFFFYSSCFVPFKNLPKAIFGSGVRSNALQSATYSSYKELPLYHRKLNFPYSNESEQNDIFD